MIMKSIQRLLDKDKSDEFERLVNLEIEKLKNNIKSVDINLILYLMGFFNE
ncbi:unknown [Firmicutes bacterium CAG:822]|nr:unknown [Firmicutes bacterium CAG:822]